MSFQSPCSVSRSSYDTGPITSVGTATLNDLDILGVITADQLQLTGRTASSLDDFVGTIDIEIDKHGSPYLIDGEGRVRDDSVRVHEKNGKGGKDVRVWRVHAGPEGFVAQTV